ncbi:phosphopantetheine binding protein [Thermosporothrix hazakensis]|uniref:Phosphopantetheine binding protein n=1 Tax=Thermosporothrix hazakensis TaxID=644383 RepID=A0A326TWQ5_THEHA|nr:condensation domain-containing protein [Thermosporothrix hazakensis]PZW20773.1 phosphopantetheine binding protein [Thermosporothrix hazakensis]GCE50459.1 hypothetical protein KTH_53280 [Thermosporothrix hazakensis]
MTLDHVLHTVQQRAIQLWVQHGELRFRAPKGAMTPDLRAEIQRWKRELIAFLEPRLLLSRPEARYEPFPLTDMQLAYLFGRTGAWAYGKVAPYYYTEIDAYNLDPKRLERAIRRLVAHHDMLRAFVTLDGQQCVAERVPPYELPVLDLRGRSAAEVEEQLRIRRERLSHQVLDPHRPPLFTFCLTRLTDQQYRLHFGLDLLFCDAYSALLLCQQLRELYERPETELPEAGFLFRDWVEHLERQKEQERYRKAYAYWMERLEHLPAGLDLPLRPVEGPARFQRQRQELAVSRWQLLKRLAAQQGLTPSGLLLAAFAEVLMAGMKRRHFLLTLTLFNRPSIYAGIERLIGDFTSTLLIEVDGQGATFLERARLLQRRLWRDLEHAAVPGTVVLRELGKLRGETMIVPIVFSSGIYDQGGVSGDASQLLTAFGKTVYSISQTPQVALDHQVFERDGMLCFNWDTVEAAFPPGLLDRLFSRYCRLLTLLAEDERSWQQSEFPFLQEEVLWTPACKQQPEPRHNAEPPVNELEKTLHAIFCAVLQREEIGVQQNFFEIGANSLLLVQAQGQICRQLGREISVLILFEYPTIRSLAAFLSQDQVIDEAAHTGQHRAARRRQALQYTRKRG